MEKLDKDMVVHHGVPPDGVPSPWLLNGIAMCKRKNIPLLHFARMRRLSYGFILHVKANYMREG